MVVRMTMTTFSVWPKADGETIVQALQEAREKLDSAEGDVLLDFSSVRRIDPRALRAMEELASLADHNGVKVVLRGINVSVYKVLKLVRLTSRFSFVS